MTEVRKNIVPPKSLSTREMYKYYKTKHPNAKEPYWMFKEIISRYNKKCADAVIFGQVLNFGSKLGYLLIKKIRRNYEKPVVDWGESRRVKSELIASGLTPRSAEHPEGHDYLIYYSDPWYLRWGWMKKRVCKVKNQTVYKFMPTSNRSKKAGENDPAKLGNKGKLVLAQKLNPMLHLVYDNHIKNKE